MRTRHNSVRFPASPPSDRELCQRRPVKSVGQRPRIPSICALRRNFATRSSAFSPPRATTWIYNFRLSGRVVGEMLGFPAASNQQRNLRGSFSQHNVLLLSRGQVMTVVVKAHAQTRVVLFGFCIMAEGSSRTSKDRPLQLPFNLWVDLFSGSTSTVIANRNHSYCIIAAALVTRHTSHIDHSVPIDLNGLHTLQHLSSLVPVVHGALFKDAAGNLGHCNHHSIAWSFVTRQPPEFVLSVPKIAYPPAPTACLRRRFTRFLFQLRVSVIWTRG